MQQTNDATSRSRGSVQLVLFNKPYDVLSQFTAEPGKSCLADFLSIKNIYPAGRLDRDSEGLLLLTDNGRLQAQIAEPRYKLAKTYWAEVEGLVSPEALASLQQGLTLKDGITLPAQAKAIPEPPLWPRNPPIRERKTIPTSWVELSIREGRNRQVRRMLAATGFPVLRLIRASIGSWTLDGLLPGEYKCLSVPAPKAKQTAHPARSNSKRHK
ncbi:MAG: pseudouridine synthase [Porticoccaceae bacterium]|nr:pseudouridine synthase [Porticoccaceae bacterium]